MRWTQWVIGVLAFITAAWFAFDGLKALTTGTYVTPSSGAHAGQLGPWSKVVSAVGIDPSSALMKWIFVLYGIAWLMIITGYLRGHSWAAVAMLIAAIGSLWYLPFGTLLGLIQIVLLVVTMRQA